MNVIPVEVLARFLKENEDFASFLLFSEGRDCLGLYCFFGYSFIPSRPNHPNLLPIITCEFIEPRCVVQVLEPDLSGLISVTSGERFTSNQETLRVMENKSSNQSELWKFKAIRFDLNVRDVVEMESQISPIAAAGLSQKEGAALKEVVLQAFIKSI